MKPTNTNNLENQQPASTSTVVKRLLKFTCIDSGNATATLIFVCQSETQNDQSNQTSDDTCLSSLNAVDADVLLQLAYCCLENRIDTDAVRVLAEIPLIKAQLTKMAKLCAQGIIEPKNDVQAFELFRHVEDQNDPDVLYAMGKRYRFGWGVSRDKAKAVEYYVKAADSGSFDATLKLKFCANQNNNHLLITAFEHFKKLADSGDQTAKFNVGRCYYFGVGVNENNELAAEAFRDSANGGCSNAVVAMGMIYEGGHSVDVAECRAFELYKQAAETGNREGQYRIATCYQNGIGVEINLDQAIFWLEKAALQGHINAAQKLGDYYSNHDFADHSHAEAFRYYKQAAVAGYSGAQYSLCCCYLLGNGTRQDYSKAVYWLVKLTDQGRKNAVFDLQKRFAELLGTPGFPSPRSCQNTTAITLKQSSTNDQSTQHVVTHELAFCLANLALEHGCLRAFECIGDCYSGGFGVARDFWKAAESYKLSRPRSVQLHLKVAVCYLSGVAADKNELDAFQMLKNANTTLRGEINIIVVQMQ